MQLTAERNKPRWNRYDTQPPFYELTVIGERPAAVNGKGLVCAERHGHLRRHCRYYDDCAENVQRGGAVLCERLIVAVAGGAVIEV